MSITYSGDDADRWYNSPGVTLGGILAGGGIGVGIAAYGILSGFAAIFNSFGPSVNDVRIAEAQAGLTEQQENVLQGSQPETFIEHDGKRYYLEIDGRPLEEVIR